MSAAGLPPPSLVFAGLMAYETSAALRSAIELDVFTAVGQGHDTAETLASACGVAPRGVRILADFLVMTSFLAKRGDRYQLTPDARAYLDRNSPHYKGNLVQFVQAPFVREQFEHLADWVRAGGATSPASALAPDHPVWIAFARVMGPEMVATAQRVVAIVKELRRTRAQQGPLKILDIAAGHGMFGISFAKDDPACRVVAQDWPRILEITHQHVQASGVADQYTLLPGDVMEVDIGAGYDLVLLPNLIHYMDRASTVKLLTRLKAALKPGGLLAIVEFAPNDDRISPSFAGFALFILVVTPAGDAYTVNEIIAMCAAAGYGQPAAWDVPNERLIVVTNPGS